MTAHRVLIVSGLSGAGKASILRALEDVGYEAVDNPPLTILEDLIGRSDRPLAIGVDARSRGFDSCQVLASLARVEAAISIRPELIFASAEETILLRRFTETRRRHPLAPYGRVSDGISAEMVLTEPLREAANLVIDTSDLPLSDLRTLIEGRFGRTDMDADQPSGLTVSLISFAFPAGIPREADMVFDVRFLRNPHYDPVLRGKSGLDGDVGLYVSADPDYKIFFSQVQSLLSLVLPRFVREGKKYATIAFGCTGGRHRSVWMVEELAKGFMAGPARSSGWSFLLTHRELLRAHSSARPS